MDSIELEDNLAWQAEVNRANDKSLRNSLFVIPFTYSGGLLLGVYLTESMRPRFWEFALIYTFPFFALLLFYSLRHKKISKDSFFRTIPELSLFICSALAAAKANDNFVFFAALVNMPLFMGSAMSALRKNSQSLFIILVAIIANVSLYFLYHDSSGLGVIVAAWLIVLPIAVISFFLSSYRYSSQKTTFFITRALNRSNHILAIKNKEIIDSITYAKNLQEAILPPENYWLQNLPNSFILYKPKDIVAGDFYWLEKINDCVFFASADCTGHGVPGAIVSVVCSNALNRTLLEFKQTDPGKILDKTRELVMATFEKSDKEVKDGMDISLCCLNTKTLELQWAGANNPLWYITSSVSSSGPDSNRDENKELVEIKANKQPIGKYMEPKPYSTHKIQLTKGDSLYIFTDGYADQFGLSNEAWAKLDGETASSEATEVKGKKFKYKQLKDLLISIQHESLESQKQKLDQAFEDWKGNLEQVDDVCIIGLRL